MSYLTLEISPKRQLLFLTVEANQLTPVVVMPDIPIADLENIVDVVSTKVEGGTVNTMSTLLGLPTPNTKRYYTVLQDETIEGQLYEKGEYVRYPDGSVKRIEVTEVIAPTT